jgi:hypothetical protein
VPGPYFDNNEMIHGDLRLRNILLDALLLFNMDERKFVTFFVSKHIGKRELFEK